MLMDEPLGALDKQLREHMQLEIRELHRRLGLTIVFVTHDQSEALTMSDRIAVFNAGKIEQLAAGRDLRPSATRFVAEFIGETNFIAASVLETSGDRTVVKLANGQQINVHAGGFAAGSDANISIRPERVKAGPAGQGAMLSPERSPMSSITEITFRSSSTPTDNLS